jgi:hypothetical protein
LATRVPDEDAAATMRHPPKRRAGEQATRQEAESVA